MASTLTEIVQAALRSATGSSNDYWGDWHAYLDAQGIQAGQIDGRILAYGQTVDSTLNSASAAHNYFLLNGVVSGMTLAGNINNGQNYTTPIAFANLFRMADPWVKVSGTGGGAFVDTRGALTSNDALDCLRARLPHPTGFDQLDWPTGQLSVSFTLAGAGTGRVCIGYGNPTTIAGATNIYDSGAQSAGSYSGSSTSISHTTINGQALYVLFQGSANLTSLTINLPNADSVTYGEWNPDFYNALVSSGIKDFRLMDALLTNSNLDAVWADRTVSTDLRWSNIQGGNTVQRWPYEMCVDLANRLGANIWVNIPSRAGYDTTYVQNLGTILNGLTGGYAYIEFSNEVWNSVFAEHTNYIGYAHVTTETATSNKAATPTFTLAGHGFVGGETVMCFNDAANTTIPTYPLYKGNTAVVKTSTVTSDTFQLASSAGGTAYTSTSGHGVLKFKRTGAASSQVWANYSSQLETIWTNLEATCARAKLKYVCATQAASPSNSLTRFNGFSAGGKLKVDYVATGPYIHPFWFECTLAGGGSAGAGLATATPTFSAANSTMVIKYAVYPSASTPTNAEVFAGTGATASNLTGTTVAYTSSTVAGTALTGLTSGTSYKLYCWTTYNGSVYLSSVAFTGATTGTMCTCTPTYADFVGSYAYETVGTGGTTLNHVTNTASMVANMASAGLTNAQLIAYEGFEEWPNATTVRTASTNPLYAAFEDATYSNAVKEFLYTMSSLGYKKFFVWTLLREDAQGIARNVTSLTNSKWTQYTSFPGHTVQSLARPTYASVSAPDPFPIISSAPSYPTSIFTLLDSTGTNTNSAGAITYEIVGGNEYGRYDISGGNSLRITQGYSAGTVDTLTIKMLAGSKTVGIASVPVYMGVTPQIPDANTNYQNSATSSSLAVNTSAGSSSTQAFKCIYNNVGFAYVNINGAFPLQPILNGQTITITLWAYRDASDTSDTLLRLGLQSVAYNTAGAPSSTVASNSAGVTSRATSNPTVNSTLTQYTLTYTNSTGGTINNYTAGAPAGTTWLQFYILKNSAADGVNRNVNILMLRATVA